MHPIFGILLTVQILISIAMGGLILIQRSEGGALGMGGGPSGFMSARGAGNLLTRITGVLAVLFFANSIGMTIVGNHLNKATSAVDAVDTSKLPLTPLTAPPAGTAQQPASSSAAPSLNDLPLATTPTAAPVPQQAAPKLTPSSSRPVTLPSSVVLPTTSGVSSSPAKDITKAKSSIWASSSAAATPSAAPSSGAASKAASSTPQ